MFWLIWQGRDRTCACLTTACATSPSALGVFMQDFRRSCSDSCIISCWQCFAPETFHCCLQPWEITVKRLLPLQPWLTARIKQQTQNKIAYGLQHAARSASLPAEQLKCRNAAVGILKRSPSLLNSILRVPVG